MHKRIFKRLSYVAIFMYSLVSCEQHWVLSSRRLFHYITRIPANQPLNVSYCNERLILRGLCRYCEQTVTCRCAFKQQ